MKKCVKKVTGEGADKKEEIQYTNQADALVKSNTGWNYCKKAEWKAKVRDASNKAKADEKKAKKSSKKVEKVEKVEEVKA